MPPGFAKPRDPGAALMADPEMVSALQLDYELGTSLGELEGKYGIDRNRISKMARRCGWMGGRVRKEAARQAALRMEEEEVAIQAQARSITVLSRITPQAAELEAVEAAARRMVELAAEHRAALSEAFRVTKQLQWQVKNLYLTREDLKHCHPRHRANVEKMTKKGVDLMGRLTESLVKIVQAEREVSGLKDAPPPGQAPGIRLIAD